MKFNDLSIQEKAAVIKLGVGSGLRSLLLIEDLYNSIQSGGNRPMAVRMMDKSNADFAKRMRDPKRMTIRDWVNSADRATHKMAWAEDDVSPYIFPVVQRHGNYLKDYSDPRYSYNDAARIALLNGDYMRVLNPQEAEWLTTNYKDYYPGFKDPLINASIGREYNMPDYRSIVMTSSPMYGIEWNPDDDELDYRDIRNKQLYLESAGKVSAKSNKGAQGIFQIMPGTAKWYQDSTGDIGDVNDPVYNERMRDWVMERNWENDVVKEGNPSNKTRMKKTLAAYNYGAGNLQNALNKALKAGVDIINGDEWINYLPNETRNYVNFIMNGMDASEYKTLEKYQEWLQSGNPYIYKGGGSIHIKPENRGKFTALKKRTGHSASWFKAHGTPALRKMATFALNARKWHHKYAYGGPEDPPKKRFKTPEKILAEKYGIEPMVMDNVIQLIPVVTLQMKNEYASTPLGLAEQFGTIGQAENTNAFQRKVREIRNSDNPMWFGAYFVPYLGLGMLLSNAAERIMSGQYGLGLFDAGLAFAPYLSKALKPFIRNTRKAFEFNVNPTNANSGIRTEYPWLNFRTTNLVYNMDFNIDPEYTKRFVNTNTPKGLLTESPLVVNENGTINNKNLIKAYKEVYRSIHPSDMKMSLSTKYNSSGKQTTLKKHLADVTKSALNFPLPKGVSRGDFVRAALIHDIGKLYTGQEAAGYRTHPLHGRESANIARFVLDKNFPEFNKPEIIGAVEYHMANPEVGSFGLHGTKDIDKYTKVNFDFLRALQAADVSRGLNYDEAASKFPQLFTYNKENPVDVNFYKGSYEDQIKNVLRPLLVRQGYDAQGIKTSNLEDRVNNFAHEHRRFFRGYTGEEEAATSLNTDLATGARRGFRDREKAFLIVPEEGFDAKYITPNYQYASQLGGKVGLVELQNTPTFSLSEAPTNDDIAKFYNNSNFQLMDITRILNSESPMGSFQKYEEPYRLQTGRSLQSDLKDYYEKTTGKKAMSFERESGSEKLDLTPYYSRFGVNNSEELADKLFPEMRKGMKDIAGIDFKPWGDEKYGFRNSKNHRFINTISGLFDDVKKADNELPKVPSIDAYGRVVKELFDKEIISKKQRDVFYKIYGPSRFKDIDDITDRDLDYVRNAFHKYIWNKNTMYNIKEKHYKTLYNKGKIRAKYSDDYKKYIGDESNTINFMRNNGTVPLWDMPNFGKNIIFGYEPWDVNPVKKGSTFNSKEPLGYIIGEDKSKVLDLPISDIKDFTPYNFEGKNKKPMGRARKGISRKTYKLGGPIKPFSYLPIPEVRY